MNNTLTLNSPLTKSDWDKICDVEFEKTEHIWYITPSGKRVDFIKSDVLDMIKAELETNTEKWWYGENSGDCFVKLSYVLEIIDNCRKSVIEGVSE